MSFSFGVLINIMLFSIMLGMGATLDLNNFKNTLKNPKPFLVGMLSQFGVMPLF